MIAEPNDMEAVRPASSSVNYSAFVPVDRRRAILTGATLPDRTHGAALFVDVSGFTAMTERLVNHFGRQEGAESVLRYINPLYDVLITVLHEHGGCVISFAGDSITCWLDGDDGRRALQCALTMQAAVKQMDVIRLTDDDVITLSVKISVAVGAARRFVVGSELAGFIDVLVGRTVLRMAAAEHVTDKGEVTADIENLWPILDDLVVSEWRNGGQIAVVTAVKSTIDLDEHRIDPSAWQLSVEQARPWLHAPVFERLQMTSTFLAELRPTTALFVGFDGIDFDNDDEAGFHLNQFIQWVQGWLYRVSGYLLQLVFGDKGSYLYASFGAPLSFHNDESRAVGVALLLRSAQERFRAIESITLGISAGQMWSGAYGGTSRTTYGLIGNETNMAARLMGKAESGQVVVSLPIVERTSDRFEFDSLGTVVIRGRSKPMPLWVAKEPWVQSPTLPRFQHELVGRIDSIAMLAATWEEVKAGEGQTVRLIGVPGIGKSHLAAVFAETHVETDVLWGNGDPSTRYSSYSVWRPVFARLLNVPLPTDETFLDMMKPRLETLGLNDDERLPLLGDLFGVPLFDNETTAGFEPQARQEALFALLETILGRVSDQAPRLIVLDNAQWLDEASLQLVLALATNMEEQSLMLLLVMRPADGDMWDALAIHSDVLALLPLNVNELNRLVRNLLDGEVAPALLDVVGRQTLGNPFFVEGLLVTMQETEKIVVEDGRWELSDDVRRMLTAANLLEFRDGEWRFSGAEAATSLDIELPNTIYASILHQLDRLSEQYKLTLKVASAIGHQFDLDLLHRIHPQNETKEEIQECATYCLKHGLIHWYDDETYTFNQHLTQEVIYSTLLYSQRRVLRSAVAQTLADPDYTHTYSTEAIADHAYEGQEWVLALRYYVQLGREAENVFANQQAIFAYQRAADCVNKVSGSEFKPQLYEIGLALGKLHSRIGDFEQVRTYLNDALALAETPYEFATVHRWLAESWEGQGEFEKALDQIYLGLRYQNEETVHSSSEMRLRAGLIHTRQGDYDEADALVEHVFQIAYDPILYGKAYGLSGIIHRLRGNSDTALTQFKKALTEYHTSSNLRGRALVLNQMATIYFDRQDYDTAEILYKEALIIFIQTGNRYHRLFVANNLGGIARLQEDYEQALIYFDEALHQLDRLNKSPYVWGMIEMNRAIVFSELGRFDEAENGFDAAERLFTQSATQDTLPELHREKARLALKQGLLDIADQLIEQSLTIARELNMSHDLSVATAIQEEIENAQNKRK